MCTSVSERATAGERGGDDGGRLMKTRTENLGPKEHEGAWHGDQYRIHYTRHGAEHWLSRPFSCMFLSRQVSYLPVPTNHAIYVHDGMVPTNTYIGLLSSEQPQIIITIVLKVLQRVTYDVTILLRYIPILSPLRESFTTA